jgi:ABC-type transport system involved in cytochrome c biogenesis permease subunit
VGLLRQHSLVMQAAGGPALALAGAGGVPAGLTAVGRGGDGERWRASAARSGGGAAGAVENPEAGLPDWLKNIDWAHQIVLNMVFILLFVGTILGAVWADYSWGRPWGWDPKEVFALNTWIIYAILIHARFVVRQRGLWTAWLSVFGCVMMAFNWFVVNLFIVGLHSYA